MVMLRSFRNPALRQFWETGATRRLPVQNAARVQRMLQALDAATKPADLNVPGYMWHPLGLMGPGRYSIRVTGNYRITYAWDGEDAVDVDIEDYH